MRIAYRNETDLPSIIVSASTAYSNYYADNLQTQRLGETYRTENVSAASIVFDLGEYPEQLNAIAIINHNFSSTVSVTISFNTTNTWPGATSQTITYNAGMMLKFFTAEPEDYLITESGDFLVTESGDYLTTDAQYRFAKVTINDPDSLEDELEIGKIWIGSYITIDPSSLTNFSITKKSTSKVMYGKSRQKFAFEGVSYREFNLDFPISDYTMVKKLEDMFDYSGMAKSVIFCNFDTDRSYQIVEPCYCSLSNDMAFDHVRAMRFEYRLRLEEDK